MKKAFNSERGQIILILILVITVALAIGVAIIQRSLSDISTSTKVEQSSRAFSAAEAGIEKNLTCTGSGCLAVPNVSFPENQSNAAITNDLIPFLPAAGAYQNPLQYPPLAKEEVAHVWLADPDSATNPPAQYYRGTSLEVYWGDPLATSADDKAALELTLIYFNSSTNKYENRKWYLDQPIARNFNNKFCQVVATDCNGTKSDRLSRTYQCKYTLGNGTATTSCANPGGAVTIDNSPLPANMMLIRARLLYNTTSQPFAVQTVDACPPGAPSCRDYSVPPQARIVTSTGTAGNTQRKVQVFRIEKVVPPYFDYAIFSAGDINKPVPAP